MDDVVEIHRWKKITLKEYAEQRRSVVFGGRNIEKIGFIMPSMLRKSIIAMILHILIENLFEIYPKLLVELLTFLIETRWKNCDLCPLPKRFLRATSHTSQEPWPWNDEDPWLSSKGRTMGVGKAVLGSHRPSSIMWSENGPCCRTIAYFVDGKRGEDMV